MNLDIENQITLVTGGTLGIGRSIVETFIEQGASVAFCARSADSCAEVERELHASLGVTDDRLFGRVADLTDRPSLKAFVDEALGKWGRIDTLICNAADFGVASALDDVDYERFERLLNANVVGNLYLCQQVLPGMEQRRSGSVILLGSIVGFTTMPNNIPYSSSKAAIASMTRSLAAQYAPANVRVNCLASGLIKTRSSQQIWEDDEVAADYVAQRVPMKRIGQPREIAEVCAFLASPAASYLTAAIIPVDGGRMGVGQPAGSPVQVKPR